MAKGNKCLRRAFYLVAGAARWLEHFNEFYERPVAEDKGVRQVTCALAGKLTQRITCKTAVFKRV